MAALLVGCAHHEPAGHADAADAPIAVDASGPDDGNDPSDASGTGIDAGSAVTDAPAADADCWSCGLPTGTTSDTVTLKQSDCIIHFVTGPSYAISDTLYVVLHGTSPSALTIDVQMHIADAFVCSSPVAADGTFGCTRHTNYNDAAAHGRIQGTAFTTSWVWEEDDYVLTCPMLTGTLQQ